MSEFDQVWRRLTQAARQVPAPQPASAPYGFAHRIAARWLAEPQEGGLDLWAFFGRRALVGAALILAAVVALNYASLQGTWNILTDSAPLVETMLAL